MIKIIINGMFNNYSMSDDYKMDFNKKQDYMKSPLIKQGYTNYHNVLTDKNGKQTHENARWKIFLKLIIYILLLFIAKEIMIDTIRVIGISITNSLYIQN